MAEKIRILEINWMNKKEVPADKDGKKNFTPINDNLWFEDQTATNDDQFRTDELGKTIDHVKIENDQISIVKNANANFFVPPKDKKAIDAVIRNLPENINVIENNEMEKSALPKEILELRKNDFIADEKSKERILQKLNIQLAEAVKTTQMKKTTLQDQLVKESKTEQVLESQSNAEKLTSFSSEQNKNVQDEKIKTPNQVLINESATTTDDFDSVEIHDKTAVIAPLQQEEPQDKKNEKALFNLPVMNNEDFTVTSTTNDFDKTIVQTEKKITHLESQNLDNTTILVNNLISEMNKVKSARDDKKIGDFDEFYNWFSRSKNSKRLSKIMKKENKKMTKKSKK